MLRVVRKGLSLMMAAGLAACSAPVTRDGGREAADIVPFAPVDQQALGGRGLISYDVYADGDVLHALFATATDAPKQNLVAYLRSEDGGRHWSAPVEVGRYVAGTMESAAGNEIQIAASGDSLLAVWQVTGEIPGMGPLRAIYSQDGGQHWSRGGNPTGNETDQSHADLVADRQGRFHLVWLDDRDENGYQGLRYARTDNAGRDWQLAQTIDESTCSCCWNRLLVGPNDEVSVLYRDMEPRDMALAQSGDAGQTWRRAATVGEFNWVFDGCPHNGGALSRSGQTLQALVWTGAENKAGLYHLRSFDNGGSWSPPLAMGGGAPAFHSDIVALNDGRVLAIWDARGPEGAVVMIAESFDNGGNWAAARRISTPGSSAQFPRLVATPDGALAMWVEQKPGQAKQWMSAILQ